MLSPVPATCSGCGLTFGVQDGVADWYVPPPDNESERVTQANIQLHDGCADSYENSDLNQVFSTESIEAARAELRLLARRGRTHRLLDIGCGSGFILRAAEPLFDEIYGIDVSQNMLKLAQRYRATLLRASAYDLPFADCVFDAVTCHATLHHLYDMARLFSEIQRVLSPDGFLYIDHDPNRLFKKWFGWQIWWRGLRLAKKRRQTFHFENEEMMHLAEYHHFHSGGIDGPQVERALRASGLADVEVRYSFPDRPDRFTRILMALDRIVPARAFHYNISFVARRPA